jgi:hypothetical protein
MDKNFVLKAFGKGFAYKLVNERIKAVILDKLEKYYKLKLFVPFGKTYKTVRSKADLSDVQNYKHLVNFHLSTKLSYLYLTEHNDVRFCYYIIGTDRNNVELYSTIQRFKDLVFSKETLFEGYILDTLEPIFLVEDLVIYGGHTVSRNLEDRIKTMNELLDYHHRADPVLDNYRIILKDYVDYAYIQSFMTEEISYKSEITGLVFSPLGNCVVHLVVPISPSPMAAQSPATQRPDIDPDRFEIVKFPTKKHVCFLVKATDKPDVYHLYLATPKGELKYYDIASIPDQISSAYINGVFKAQKDKAQKDKAQKDTAIMVCRYDERTHIQRWQPVMISNRKSPDTILRIAP